MHDVCCLVFGKRLSCQTCWNFGKKRRIVSSAETFGIELKFGSFSFEIQKRIRVKINYDHSHLVTHVDENEIEDKENKQKRCFGGVNWVHGWGTTTGLYKLWRHSALCCWARSFIFIWSIRDEFLEEFPWLFHESASWFSLRALGITRLRKQTYLTGRRTSDKRSTNDTFDDGRELNLV